MDEREVIGVWDCDSGSLHAPRNKKHRDERWEFIKAYFRGEYDMPRYIWRVEFFRTVRTPRSSPEQYDYGMTLHRYAAKAEGGRHMVWVKAYDARGRAVSERLAAVVEPENYKLDRLPPDWLLHNHPKGDRG